MKTSIPTLQACGKIDRAGILLPGSHGIAEVARKGGGGQYHVFLAEPLAPNYVVMAMDADAGFTDDSPDRIMACGAHTLSDREFVVRVMNSRSRNLSVLVFGMRAETTKSERRERSE